MRNNSKLVAFHLALIALLALTGCSKKAEVNSSVSELQKAFPQATAAPSESAPVKAVSDAASASADANTYVSAALSAARASDYGSGVIALQQAQHAKGVTANQLMTIQQARQAMVTDLMIRADRGDAKAKADLARIEKTLSQ